jgi:hypothetical protein
MLAEKLNPFALSLSKGRFFLYDGESKDRPSTSSGRTELRLSAGK